MNNNVSLRRQSILNVRLNRKINTLEEFNTNNPKAVQSQWGSYTEEKEYLAMAYHLLLKRGFENVKPILKILLKKFKHCSDSDIQKLLSTKDPNVSQLFNYISNLQRKVTKRNLPNKINKIYLERKGIDITSKVNQLTQAEKEIKSLNNKLMNKLNQLN